MILWKSAKLKLRRTVEAITAEGSLIIANKINVIHGSLPQLQFYVALFEELPLIETVREMVIYEMCVCLSNLIQELITTVT
jgi:hypothetical protein